MALRQIDRAQASTLFEIMFDAADNQTQLQRSTGHASVTLGPHGLIDLAQSGSARALLPRSPSGPPEVVFLNTSGGLAAGDDLEFSLNLRASTQAVATTQTAERAYHADRPAHARVTLQVAKNGWLDWLPQETILFDGARLTRDTTIDLAEGAGGMMLETIILGRHAMGERVSHLHLRDRRIVRRQGRIIHHDALALDDAAVARLEDPAMMGDARALATITIISPHATDLLDRARAAIEGCDVRAAVSAPPGRLILRLLAAEGWPLRRQIVRLLAALRAESLPRVWQVSA